MDFLQFLPLKRDDIYIFEILVISGIQIYIKKKINFCVRPCLSFKQWVKCWPVCRSGPMYSTVWSFKQNCIKIASIRVWTAKNNSVIIKLRQRWSSRSIILLFPRKTSFPQSSRMKITRPEINRPWLNYYSSGARQIASHCYKSPKWKKFGDL